jgi:phosphoribosyl-ATP pyrophosphohydrolase/phosphoribosyl-AMP cyclohydrolase
MNNLLIIENLNWDKIQNLIPAIIQHYLTGEVLMLGYMNKLALTQSMQEKQVTFYSRSKERLWKKGETSGNQLHIISIAADCDQDSLLVLVNPLGPTCHLGNKSCFTNAVEISILSKLESIIKTRFDTRPEKSYTSELFAAGIKRMAQKVGEEGVEVALAAMSANREELINESADLIFHLLVLLKQCDVNLSTVLAELDRRMQSSHEYH